MSLTQLDSSLYFSQTSWLVCVINNGLVKEILYTFCSAFGNALLVDNIWFPFLALVCSVFPRGPSFCCYSFAHVVVFSIFCLVLTHARPSSCDSQYFPPLMLIYYVLQTGQESINIGLESGMSRYGEVLGHQSIC